MRKLLRRASFLSKADLKDRIERFIAYFNQTMAKPFKWTWAGKPLRRAAYRDRIARAGDAGPLRSGLACGNLAHGFAACGVEDKAMLAGDVVPNLAIVTSYNDMLSAHQPYERFPDLIRQAAREAGGVAQVAGGVPAMCDGVTQGQQGMELSLFSRDVIAMSAGIALSHNMFDAAVFLGICDKIVPGLLMAALTFGHLPAIFIPAGPMTTGFPTTRSRASASSTPRARSAAPNCSRRKPKSYHWPRHLHVLRHRQHQPDADGDHGPASARRRPSSTPTRRCAMR